MNKNNQSILLKTVLIDVLLIVLKITGSILSNSASLLTDAIHSGTDVISRLIAYLGLKISHKEESNAFPFGLHKIENFVAILISILIVGSGLGIINTAIGDLLKFSTVDFQYNIITIILSLITVVISIIMSFTFQKLYHETKSPIIKAVAEDYKSDTIVTSSIFISVIISSFGVPAVDRLLAIIISLVLIYNGGMIGYDSIKVLLDMNDPEFTKKVTDLLEAEKTIKLKDVKVRKGGSLLFISVTIGVSGNYTMEQVQTYIVDLKQKINRKIENIGYLAVIVESSVPEIEKIAIALDENKQNKSILSMHFGKTEFFAFVKKKDNDQYNNMDIEIIKNPCKDLKQKKGIKTVDFLVENKITKLIIPKIDEESGAHYALHNAGIQVIITDKSLLAEVISSLNL